MNRPHSRNLIDELTGFLSEDMREEYEERAAVMEFDGGMSRECAEFAAAALVLLRHHPALTGLHVTRVGGRHGLAIGPAPNAPLGAAWALPGSPWAGLAASVRALGGVAVPASPDSTPDGADPSEN